MEDEGPYEERPEYLPDGEVAKALKRQWAWLRAVPASKKVGALNILFGVLSMIEGCVSAVSAARLYAEARRADAIYLEEQIEASSAMVRALYEAHTKGARGSTGIAARFVAGATLGTLNALFLSVSGLLLILGTHRARGIARIALLLIPFVFLVQCAIYWYPAAPEWAGALSRAAAWLSVGYRPVLVGIAIVSVLWVIIYPWLALGILKREAAAEAALADTAEEM